MQVQEETGFDLTKYIRADDNIKMTIREQSVTLFVVGGIPEDYPFQCRTRKEISVSLFAPTAFRILVISLIYE